MDEDLGREYERLYQVVLAIGSSLDTETMLSAALGAFVEQLACSAGAVFLASTDVLPDEPAVAIPSALAHNAAVRVAASLLPARTPEQWCAFHKALPQQGVAKDGKSYLLLPVGRQGMLVLAGQAVGFPPARVNALAPLLDRLEQAYQICLQHAELAAAHRSNLLENNILHTLLETSPTVLFALDQEGTYTFSEGSGLESFGHKPGEVVGQSIFDTFGNVPYLRDNVVHDVTERKAAIDALSAVLQTVGEGILSLDEAGRILMVNPELERIFGYTATELLGKSFDGLLSASEMLPPSVAECAGASSWRGLLGVRFETSGRRKDGTVFPVEVCINELAPGLWLRYTGSLRDISERREYERLRDEFVSTVSHELRTPLASIMGWTETLLTEHPGPINDVQRRFLNTVYASSQRLNRLIEEILTVSRIQRGTLRVHHESMNPAHLLAAVRTDAMPAAERQGVHLRFEDTWPGDGSLLGDPHLLEQVLNHLIGNAIKFSREDSDVYIRSQATPLGWRVEIEDHGMGVPAADLPKLFSRFVRGSNAKEAHTQGAGLGLFVSKAIVEAHGGTIFLKSRAGEGTIVNYELPLEHPRSEMDLSYGA